MNKKIIIIAGGTGGHIYPALNIACLLMKQGWEVRWLGCMNRMESYIIPQKGIKINLIDFTYFKTKNIFFNIFTLWKLIKALFYSINIYKTYKPDIILSMGSYISGPPGIAAWLYRIPLVIHEQNNIAGFTNKILSKFAIKIMQAYPYTFNKGILVGNPVNKQIIKLSVYKRATIKIHHPIHVFITGGSQGSQTINILGVKLAYILKYKISILHQVGQNNLIHILNKYKKNKVNNFILKEYIPDMYEAYKWADIIISRSGAMTVSEITIIGLPAIFIPFKHKDKQQYLNAIPLKNIGAAEIFEQDNINIHKIAYIILSLNTHNIKKMLVKSNNLCIYNSTELICNEINLIFNKN
ncbi:undecaprenyldiphospho-muramoylpentapeptide beta-N-acetylglucosaminyltransferase [Enterobacteriaceae endosymbiont of Neohaemonia nigricornis]|uniref:undecaprenyldiphospho-muramoylpentapeptide beta-N-acetylglucosaminyltransferase n=1 Tax=Enterobacteriaceae endosymbiont of Neohaemonia nigricornis TaxID=2675792 RepID=UPI00144A1C43|nr:undecaprenyldiphospho-muramoylpentapeptide beta-N-acetylglucosaminyltransferase [Enterobacteriaceae endosymbiont of Neohaemonia nigricornis]QJC30343.1 undecaprenyldiphospho-muramoylpentapeptide beta-N-acetylglucosaminyltransferase [Enterobacteriaceae endosymbiont of Neohaemonia nigricornis]